MSNIKYIRMQSGEDVVAEVVGPEKGSQVITIKNAIVAVPTGQGQLGFAPWAPILHKSKNELEIKHSSIVFIAEVDDDIANQHKSMYGGIVTPSSSKLIV